MFCDVDRLKKVNDCFGHSIGDQVLRAIANSMKASVRSGDLVARIGGDEFLVMLDGVSDLDEALAIAENLRAVASQTISVPSGSITTTLSIGVTVVRPGEDIDDIIARADQAMYLAKQAGRDQVIPIFTESA
jgi:diguanylate cyclase (GGDEF)-like protein